MKSQRRRPRQARSRATYAAILEAASQILERDGPGGFNTNAVAQRAGVSVGTLYQYFPDKAAVLVAAAERELGAAPLQGRQQVLLRALLDLVERVGRLGGGPEASRAGGPAVGAGVARTGDVVDRVRKAARRVGMVIQEAVISLAAVTLPVVVTPAPVRAYRAHS